ncbi:hypothetical protein [Methylibium sp.]|uniref:HD-GYP domain-containing protein n=1 Tax=Methylibium sp. TaxID=2067992 RepID=UPI0025E45E57|nr:hypothetical protein [Methylibium sp.]
MNGSVLARSTVRAWDRGSSRPCTRTTGTHENSDRRRFWLKHGFTKADPALILPRKQVVSEAYGWRNSPIAMNCRWETRLVLGADLPPPAANAAAAGTVDKPFATALHELHAIAGQLLIAAPNDPLWADRVRALAQRLGILQQRALDAVLYLLLYAAARRMERYSSHHALVCAVIARECAARLSWPDHETQSLVLAALTMNVSITALQDELVFRERTPTLAQRVAIDAHPDRSVELLGAHGVTDALWLGAVAQHHVDFNVLQIEGGLSAEQRLAQVLRRVDVLAAKISPRQSRPGLPATMAVRDAYLGVDGAADEVGAALTKAVGIYPPGSLVTLETGETAIVLRRGARASRPIVAAVAGATRAPYTMAVLLDTNVSGSRIRGAASPGESRIPLDHDRLLMLLSGSLFAHGAPAQAALESLQRSEELVALPPLGTPSAGP